MSFPGWHKHNKEVSFGYNIAGKGKWQDDLTQTGVLAQDRAGTGDTPPRASLATPRLWDSSIGSIRHSLRSLHILPMIVKGASWAGFGAVLFLARASPLTLLFKTPKPHVGSAFKASEKQYRSNIHFKEYQNTLPMLPGRDLYKTVLKNILKKEKNSGHVPGDVFLFFVNRARQSITT